MRPQPRVSQHLWSALAVAWPRSLSRWRRANPPSEQTASSSSTGLDGLEDGTAAEGHRVGWGFISLYTLAFISTSLVFLAPLLVTLALKVNSLGG
jgi:hypothetical protein